MRFFKILTLSIFAVLLMSAVSLAGYHGGRLGASSGLPGSLDNFTQTSITNYLSRIDPVYNFQWPFAHNDVPEGQWDITFVYKEADHANTWTTADGLSLSTQDAYGTALSHVELGGSSFSDGTVGAWASIANGWAVRLYEVINPFQVGGTSFLAGDLLIGFNDSWIGDRDFDDLVLRGRAATPIPGAAWLLGTGLLGLVGLRRRFRI